MKINEKLIPGLKDKVDIYNIITNGEPVKTGRKVDGKDEYVKMIETTLGNYVASYSNRTWTIPTGLSNITLTRELNCFVQTGAGNVLNCNMPRFQDNLMSNTSQCCYYDGSSNNIIFMTAGADRTGVKFTGYLYFTYN